MGFGKRAPGALAASRRAGAARQSRRRIAGTALFGILLGFGVLTATSVVRAAEGNVLNGLFEAIFGTEKAAPDREAKAATRTPRRYASLPDAQGVAENRLVQRTPRLDVRPVRARSRAAKPAVTGPGLATRTVCVRLCDGYVFPLGRLRSRADLPVHSEACAAACPNARTELFTLASGKAEMERAVGLDGQPYLRTAHANLFRRQRVDSCSCQPPGLAGPLMPLAQDRTLRPGDVVASDASAGLVTRISLEGLRLVDYRVADLSRRRRDAIEDRVGALRRDARAAGFRQVLRAADIRSQRLRFAEARVESLRSAMAAPGFAPLVSRSADPAPVRVVAPSPFGQ